MCGPGPLFSVIVPVYKVEKYLHQCVDSILGQTYTHLEVILVDDGSPDDCGAICDAYARQDTRVRVIHKANGGLISARKAGAEVCTGDYVLNVDSDDFIAPDLVESLAAIIHKYHPDVIAFDCMRYTDGCQELMSNHIEQGLYEGEKLDKLHRSLLLDEKDQFVMLYNIWAKAAKRELYLPYQMALWEGMCYGEDLAVTAPMMAHCESVYVSDLAGYYYRNTPKSITNNFRITEIGEQKLLGAFLLEAMGPAYQSRIDVYMALKYGDFLDRAMVTVKTYSAYLDVIHNTLDEEMLAYFHRAHSNSPRFTERLLVFLIKHQWFGVFWLLRHIKKRK